MKYSSFYNESFSFDDSKRANIEEIILASKDLSRFGSLEVESLNGLAIKISEEGLRPILEWDILMTSEAFDRALLELEKIDLKLFYSIRVQDPGALYYILENYPDLRIQLNLEMGNHNLRAIKGWVEIAGEKLDKVILSSELNREKIKKYSEYFKESNFRFEILGLGKILLFYTPRTLLSNQVNRTQDYITAIGKSEETPHKGFKILENMHGTFMFNPKELCLLDFLDEIDELENVALRLDFSFCDNPRILKEFVKLSPIDFVIEFLPKSTKGFFRVNKTKSVFKRLKNSRIIRNDKDYLGQVVGVKKNKHLALHIKNRHEALKVGDTLEFHTPDGKIKKHKVSLLRNSEKQVVHMGIDDQLVILDHITGVSIKTNVYRDSSFS